MGTTELILLYLTVFIIAVLNFLTNCVLAQDVIRIDKLVPSSGSPYTPTPVSGTTNHYDIPAGSDLTITCGKTAMDVRYPTNKYAQFNRFDLGERVGLLQSKDTPGGRWRFFTLQHYDTGPIECYSAADLTNASLHSSIYIFVYDPSKSLHVPLKISNRTNETLVSINKQDYVPCLPTHSEVIFHVTDYRGQAHTSATLSNTQGFRLNRRPLHISFLSRYTCNFAYPAVNRTDQLVARVSTVEGLNIPKPVISAAVFRQTYLPGEDLVLNCTIYEFTSVISVNWSYPGQHCDTGPPTSCTVGMQGRVQETSPRLVSHASSVFSTLSVRNLQKSDSGNYSCRYKHASGVASSDSDSIEMRVLSAATVGSAHLVKTFNSTANISLNCGKRISHHLKPLLFIWTRYGLVQDTKASVLELNPLAKGTEENIICNADTQEGISVTVTWNILWEQDTLVPTPNNDIEPSSPASDVHLPTVIGGGSGGIILLVIIISIGTYLVRKRKDSRTVGSSPYHKNAVDPGDPEHEYAAVIYHMSPQPGPPPTTTVAETDNLMTSGSAGDVDSISSSGYEGPTTMRSKSLGYVCDAYLGADRQNSQTETSGDGTRSTSTPKNDKRVDYTYSTTFNSPTSNDAPSQPYYIIDVLQ